MPSRRHCRTWTSSWRISRGEPTARSRTNTNRPSVVASAPGAAHREITSTAPSRRSIRTRRASEELGGELLAVGRGARVVGTHHLEQVDEALAGVVVVLDPRQQAVELVGDVVAGVDADAGERGDPPRVGRLGDALEERQRLRLVLLGTRAAPAARRGRRRPPRGPARARAPAGATPRRRRRGARRARPPPRWAAGRRRTRARSPRAGRRRSRRRPCRPSGRRPPGCPAPGTPPPSAGWRRRRPWPARPCRPSRRSPSRGSGRASCTGRTTPPRGRPRRAPAWTAPPPRWGRWRR